ncbi:Kinesin-like protein Klp61F [Diplonema papillatum]|nr:Kinesin-like protein Klp61F [Diplonema papillatum]
MAHIATKKAPQKKSEHVKVFVRARPLQNGEPKATISLTDKDVVAKAKNSRGHNTYSFQRVFEPESSQEAIFEAACKPLVAEMLKGFSCTIFAYGQTNSGKTHTMMGDLSSERDQGLTPRSCKYIFNELLKSNQHFTVRLSCVELYKEEFYDMMVTCDDHEKRPRLKLLQDGNRGVVMKGVEEVVVTSPNDVIRQLEDAISRRSTAATGMNNRSSRSHFIATIIVTVKEETMTGEELFKIGKLHLVDLAGSESAKRADTTGTDRQSEAAAINKSLLTLGRVISALSCSESSHTPYRESALTRLLQDALGGKSKTSIITTISLAKPNIDETLSTLDYAASARKIENDPEMNRVLSGNQIVCDYESELVRLRTELTDQRNGTGVYISEERYTLLQSRLKELEEDQLLKAGQVAEFQEKLEQIKAEMDAMAVKQRQKNALLSHHLATEGSLLDAIESSAAVEDGLRAVVEARDTREARNFDALRGSAEEQTSHITRVDDALNSAGRAIESVRESAVTLTAVKTAAVEEQLSSVAASVSEMEESSTALFTNMESFTKAFAETQGQNIEQLKESTGAAVDQAVSQLSNVGGTVSRGAKALADGHKEKLSATFEQMLGQFVAASRGLAGADGEAVRGHVAAVTAAFKAELTESLQDITQLLSDRVQSNASAWTATAEGHLSATRAHCATQAGILQTTEQGVAAASSQAAAAVSQKATDAAREAGEETARQLDRVAGLLMCLEEREAAARRKAHEQRMQLSQEAGAARVEANSRIQQEIARITAELADKLDQVAKAEQTLEETLVTTLHNISKERKEATETVTASLLAEQAKLQGNVRATVEENERQAQEIARSVSDTLRGAHDDGKTHLQAAEAAAKAAGDGAAKMLSETRLAAVEICTARDAKFDHEIDTEWCEKTEGLTDGQATARAALVSQFQAAVGRVLGEQGEALGAGCTALGDSAVAALGEISAMVTENCKGVTHEGLDTMEEATRQLTSGVRDIAREALTVVSEKVIEVKGHCSTAGDQAALLKENMHNGMTTGTAEVQSHVHAAQCVAQKVKETVELLLSSTARHQRGETPSPCRAAVRPTTDYPSVLQAIHNDQYLEFTTTPQPVPRQPFTANAGKPVAPPLARTDSPIDEDYVPLISTPTHLSKTADGGSKTPLGFRSVNVA